MGGDGPAALLLPPCLLVGQPGPDLVVRRPVALFVPVAAIVFSLKNCEGYIRAILIKQLERQSLNKGAGTMSRVCSVPCYARFLSASCACLCVFTATQDALSPAQRIALLAL